MGTWVVSVLVMGVEWRRVEFTRGATITASSWLEFYRRLGYTARLEAC